MKKKERKELLVKVHIMLRNGIAAGDPQMIVEAYRWYQDLMCGDGIYVLEDELPAWASDI